MCCNTDCFAKYINMYCTCTVLLFSCTCSLNSSLLLLQLWLICTCTHACILMLYAIILYQNYWGNTNSVLLCLAKDTTDTVTWTYWVCGCGYSLSHRHFPHLCRLPRPPSTCTRWDRCTQRNLHCWDSHRCTAEQQEWSTRPHLSRRGREKSHDYPNTKFKPSVLLSTLRFGSAMVKCWTDGV